MWTARAQRWRGPTPKKGIENLQRTTSAKSGSRLKRSRLAHAQWRQRYKRPLWTARAPQRRRLDSGLTPKKGIENHERTTIASRLVRSPCTMARSVQTSYGDGEGSATAAVRRQRRASRTTSAQRERLDLTDRHARWRDRYKRPMWTARAQRWRRSDAKEGHREPSAHNERVSTRTIALHDGESGINVLCGRREHSGGGLTPKKGIESHERKEHVST
jgi:hypothetical protein